MGSFGGKIAIPGLIRPFGLVKNSFALEEKNRQQAGDNLEFTVENKKFLNYSVIELELKALELGTVGFKAGQFMMIKTPAGFVKHYITSVPDHNRSILFLINASEHSPEGSFYRSLKIGQGLTLSKPKGLEIFSHFDRDVFFIAQNLGISPFASIIPDLLARGYERKSRLLFCLKDEERLFYFDRFSHLSALYDNFVFNPLLSSPKSHWPGEIGQLTTYVEIHINYYKNFAYYISIPDFKTQNLTIDLLEKNGIKKTDIVTLPWS